MPPIETIARPCRNRISVSVPREYSSYSLPISSFGNNRNLSSFTFPCEARAAGFQVILVPLGVDVPAFVPAKPRKKRSFVDALLSCPKLDDGETLDVSRDPDDCGRTIDL